MNVRVHKQKQNQRSASLLILHDLLNHLTLGEGDRARHGERMEGARELTVVLATSRLEQQTSFNLQGAQNQVPLP